MKIFISGGCKNGKSFYAQLLSEAQSRVNFSESPASEGNSASKLSSAELLTDTEFSKESKLLKEDNLLSKDELPTETNGPLFYVATMRPVDDEDRERILRHIRERDGFNFLTREVPENILSLLEEDSAASFLIDSTTALLANEMFPLNSNPNFSAAEKISGEFEVLLSHLKNVVVVSDYIYSDVFYDSFTEEYRKGLALIDKACAKHCDVVLEIVYGSIVVHKGKELVAGKISKDGWLDRIEKIL